MDHLQHESDLLAQARGAQLRAADKITGFVGSMTFIYAHLAWWAFWVLLASSFDHYPFNLLTLIVSLEAILLSTFVMISQNRQSRRDEIRADLDFRTNVHSDVLAEHLAAKLGLDVDALHDEVDRRIADARAHDG